MLEAAAKQIKHLKKQQTLKCGTRAKELPSRDATNT